VSLNALLKKMHIKVLLSHFLKTKPLYNSINQNNPVVILRFAILSDSADRGCSIIRVTIDVTYVWTGTLYVLHWYPVYTTVQVTLTLQRCSLPVNIFKIKLKLLLENSKYATTKLTNNRFGNISKSVKNNYK
jgi:hypothetical protein